MAQVNPLTDTEKSRIKHFLEFPDWEQLAASIQLGWPASSQPMYLLEYAIPKLTSEALDSVRRDLCNCESIERQLGEARNRLKASELGSLKVNGNELAQLRQELLFWALTLANDLGCGINPYSAMQTLGGGGGRNARVLG